MMLVPQARPSFAPPRAGRLRGAWSAWYAFRRRTRLQLPRVPAGIRPAIHSWHDAFAIVVPIYGWHALGRRDLALYLAIAYAACALVAVTCFALPAAGWAIGVMTTLHGLGIAEYFYSGALSPRPEHRAVRYALVVTAVGIVYALVSPRLFAPFVTPMEFGGDVLLIDVRSPPASVARNEIVAFRHPAWRNSNYVILEGTNLGRVTGLAGDVVTFQGAAVLVNGVSYPRLRGMPGRGELKVPAQHTLVWPFDLRREFRSVEEAMAFAAKAAVVPDSNLTGRPYTRWFLRRLAPVTVPK